jgi:hypothetical protein
MFEARVKVIPHKFQPDENQTGSQYHFQPRLRSRVCDVER